MIAGKATGRYGPDSWSDTNSNIGAYAKSKTLAEKAAWEAITDGDMELTVINPGAVYGPSLGSEVAGESLSFMRDIIGGKMPMVPDIAMGMVDVRDGNC
jgi:dihydroflavonol-4-reductase